MEGNNCIGILKEEKTKWERRVALTPVEVEKLVKEGFRVIVQPSTSRCYSEEEFEEVGAEISDDLSSCQLIIGVKEAKIGELLENKTYMFFSHTIKAQDYNMPLLDKLL